MDRLQLAKQEGFVGVEILNPYGISAEKLAQVSQRQNCPVYLINTFFDPNTKHWGSAADELNIDRFQSEMNQAVRYAEILGATFIHVLSGTNGSLDTLLQNLCWACSTFPKQTFLIEPICRNDIENYIMSDFDDALKVIKSVNLPNLGLQFDTYHTSRMGLNVIKTFDECLRHIRHVQISGNPNRTEPDQGIIDHFSFFNHVDASAYDGLIGAEYKPNTGSFDWLAKAR